MEIRFKTGKSGSKVSVKNLDVCTRKFQTLILETSRVIHCIVKRFKIVLAIYSNFADKWQIFVR